MADIHIENKGLGLRVIWAYTWWATQYTNKEHESSTSQLLCIVYTKLKINAQYCSSVLYLERSITQDKQDL